MVEHVPGGGCDPPSASKIRRRSRLHLELKDGDVDTRSNAERRNDASWEEGSKLSNLNAHLVSVSLILVSIIAAGTILVYLKGLLIPFFVALFLMYLLDPLVKWLTMSPRQCWLHSHAPAARKSSNMRRQSFFTDMSTCCFDTLVRLHFPRWFAVICALAVAVGFIVLVVHVVFLSIETLKSRSGIYQAEADRLFKELRQYGIDIKGDIVPSIITYAHNSMGLIVSTTIAAVEKSVVVLIFLVYLLLSPIRPTNGIPGKIDFQIKNYIYIKTVISVFVALVVGITLSVVGVDLAWVFAFFAFLANYIPNLGSIVSTALPIPLILLNPDIHAAGKVMAIAIPWVTHFMCGNFVEPRIFGHTLDIHPVVVLLSLAGWARLWGVAGMILSVPMLIVVHIILDNTEGHYARVVVGILDGRFFNSSSFRTHSKETLFPDGTDGGGGSVSSPSSVVRVPSRYYPSTPTKSEIEWSPGTPTARSSLLPSQRLWDKLKQLLNSGEVEDDLELQGDGGSGGSSNGSGDSSDGRGGEYGAVPSSNRSSVRASLLFPPATTASGSDGGGARSYGAFGVSSENVEGEGGEGKPLLLGTPSPQPRRSF